MSLLEKVLSFDCRERREKEKRERLKDTYHLLEIVSCQIVDWHLLYEGERPLSHEIVYGFRVIAELSELEPGIMHKVNDLWYIYNRYTKRGERINEINVYGLNGPAKKLSLDESGQIVYDN